MKHYRSAIFCAVAGLVLLSACANQTAVKSADNKEPDILVVHADGSMEFRNRKMDADDVVIYNDGRGGERAAVKMSLEPLHPPYYRDSIIVVRKPSAEDS